MIQAVSVQNPRLEHISKSCKPQGWSLSYLSLIMLQGVPGQGTSLGDLSQPEQCILVFGPEQAFSFSLDQPFSAQGIRRGFLGIARFLQFVQEHQEICFDIPTTPQSPCLDSIFIDPVFGAELLFSTLWPPQTIDTWEALCREVIKHVTQKPDDLPLLISYLLTDRVYLGAESIPSTAEQLQWYRMAIATEVRLRLRLLEHVKSSSLLSLSSEQVADRILAMRRLLACLAMPDSLIQWFAYSKTPRECGIRPGETLIATLPSEPIITQCTNYPISARRQAPTYFHGFARHFTDGTLSDFSFQSDFTDFTIPVWAHQARYLSPPAALLLHHSLRDLYESCAPYPYLDVDNPKPRHIRKFQPHLDHETSFSLFAFIHVHLAAKLRTDTEKTSDHDTNLPSIYHTPITLWDVTQDPVQVTGEGEMLLGESSEMDSYIRTWYYHCAGLSRGASRLRMFAESFNDTDDPICLFSPSSSPLTCTWQDSARVTRSRIDTATYLPPSDLLRVISIAQHTCAGEQSSDHLRALVDESQMLGLPITECIELLNKLTAPVYDLVVDFLASRPIDDCVSRDWSSFLSIVFPPNTIPPPTEKWPSLAHISRFQRSCPLENPLTCVVTLVPTVSHRNLDLSLLNYSQSSEKKKREHIHQLIVVASFDVFCERLTRRELLESFAYLPPAAVDADFLAMYRSITPVISQCLPLCIAMVRLLRCVQMVETHEHKVGTSPDSALVTPLGIDNPILPLSSRDIFHEANQKLGLYFRLQQLSQFDLDAPWIPRILPTWARCTVVLDMRVTSPHLPNALEIVVASMCLFVHSDDHFGTFRLPPSLDFWVGLLIGQRSEDDLRTRLGGMGWRNCPEFAASIHEYYNLLKLDADTDPLEGVLQRLNPAAQSAPLIEVGESGLRHTPWNDQAPTLGDLVRLRLEVWQELVQATGLHLVPPSTYCLLFQSPHELSRFLNTQDRGSVVTIVRTLMQALSRSRNSLRSLDWGALIHEAAWMGDPFACEAVREGGGKALE